MAVGEPPTTALDPVVEEALVNLTTWVFRRRRIGVTRAPRTLVDDSARSAAIHTFMHLRHHGYVVEPFEVRRWANANGWPSGQAQLLSDYAAGVYSGLRYHTTPDPVAGRFAEWQRRALARSKTQ